MKIIKLFKNLVDFLRRFSGPGELRRFWSDKIKKMRPWGQSHLFYMHRKFQLHSFLRFFFLEKSGQRDPSKIAISQNRKWCHQNKKYIKFLSNFYNYVLVVKISWKSTQPISVHKK